MSEPREVEVAGYKVALYGPDSMWATKAKPWTVVIAKRDHLSALRSWTIVQTFHRDTPAIARQEFEACVREIEATGEVPGEW